MRAVMIIVSLVLIGNYVDDHYFQGQHMRGVANMIVSMARSFQR